MSKYGAIRQGVHASKREARRWDELVLLERIGEISELKRQTKHVLIPKQAGERAVTYTDDFSYRDKQGNFVVEDSKGFKTQQYVIRRKLMLFVHGIKVLEV